jgi:hypothetical protein
VSRSRGSSWTSSCKRKSAGLFLLGL